MTGDAVTIGLLFFVGFLALAGCGITILRYWLVEGTLDGAVATIITGCMLFFTAVAIETASPALMGLWIFTVIAATIAVPALAARNEKNALLKLQEEDVARYRRSIKNNPQNYLAWQEMGEVYMRMNRYEEAIAAFKEAIKLNPPDVEKIRRRLNAALEYRAGILTAETTVCDACHKETPKAKVCVHCGLALELNFLDWLLQRDTLLRIVRPALAVTAGVVATAIAFSSFPVAIKVAIVALCTVVAIILIWRIIVESG